MWRIILRYEENLSYEDFLMVLNTNYLPYKVIPIILAKKIKKPASLFWLWNNASYMVSFVEVKFNFFRNFAHLTQPQAI